MEDLLSKLNQKKITQYQAHLEKLDLSESTIKRRLSSLRKFNDWAEKKGYLEKEKIPSIRKPSFTFLPSKFRPTIPTVPYLSNAYEVYHSISITKYLHYAILIIFCVGLGVGIYYQLTGPKAELAEAYPTALTPPKRYLSFQGRLTDSSNNPITVSTNFEFKLWDQVSGGTEGTCTGDTGEDCLWKSGTCPITPDQDGIFSVILGSDCGSEIDASVFSEYAEVWLEVKVSTETLDPRIQIATVGYALNAATLQGYPPGTATSTIPYIDSTGKVTIAAASPTIESTSGTFGVTGQALSITTATGSDGNITLAPDGAGVLNINLSGTSGNQVRITDANITSGALVSAYAGTDSTGFDLLKLSSGASETVRFFVDESGHTFIAGNLGIGTSSPSEKLHVAGDVALSGALSAGDSTPDDHAWHVFGTGEKDEGAITDAEDVYVSGDLEVDGTIYGAGISGYVDGSGTPNYIPKWQDSDTLTDSVLYDDGTNVGIGTTAPAKGFEVINAGANDFATIAYPIIKGQWSGIHFGYVDANSLDLHRKSAIVFERKDSSESWGSIHILNDGTSDNSNADLADARLTITRTGNVGIGTTSPSGTLEIASGQILAPNGSSSAPSYSFSTDTDTGMYRVNTNWLGFTAGGTVRVGISNTPQLQLTSNAKLGWSSGGIGGSTDTNLYRHAANVLRTDDSLIIDGNLGIGTTDPSQLLHVAGAMRLEGALYDVNNQAGTSDQILSSTGTGVDWVDISSIGIGGTGTTGYVPKWLSSSTLGDSVIYEDGTNVGIGVTNPSQKLEVAGDFTFDANNRSIWRKTSKRITLNAPETVFNEASADINFRVEGDTDTHLIFADAGEDAVGIGYSSLDSASGKLLINGNVGIGTTGPGALLDIDGGGGSTTGLEISNLGTANYAIDLTNTGLSGTSDYFIYKDTFNYWNAAGGLRASSLRGESVTTKNNLVSSHGNNDLNLKTGGAGTGVITFYTNNSEQVRIDTSGYLGIGTTAPSQELHIEGDMRLTGGLYDVNNQAGTSDQILSSTGTGVDWVDISSIGIGGTGTTGYVPKWLSSSTLGDSVIYDDGTNVGIGTTGPGSKLDVNGNLIVRDSNDSIKIIGSIPEIYYDTTTDWQVGTGWSGSVFGTDAFYFLAAGSEKVSIDSNGHMYISGNLGIGTTAPSQELHIDGNMRLTGALYDYNNQAGTSDQILSSTGTGVDWVDISSIGIGGTGTTGYVPKWLSSSTLGDSVIYEDGTNVGIGTTGPSEKLEVSGRITPSVHLDSNHEIGSTSKWWNKAYLYNISNYYFNSRYFTVGEDDLSFIRLDRDDRPLSFGDDQDYAIGYNASSDTLQFVDGEAIGSNVRVVIDSGGNVGIGATSPADTLAVSGGVIIGSGYAQLTSAPSNGLIVEGNVGIGTTGPQTILNVDGGTGSLSTGLSFGDGDTGFYENSDDDFRFAIAGSPVIALNSQNLFSATNGSWQLKHSVAASATQPVFMFYGDTDTGIGKAGTDILSLIAGGVNVLNVTNANVGIGTTDPSQELHIEGNMRLTGALYDVNNQAGTSDQILSSTGTGVDWVDISSIGIGGTGTTGYVPKWLSSSTLGNSVIFEDGTNVGIGLTNPSEKLYVSSGNIRVDGTLRAYNIYLQSGGYNNIISTYNNNPIVIDPNGTGLIVMVPDATDGNVGIGTTNPGAKFEVVGDANISMSTAADEIIISQSSATGTEDQPLIFIDDDRTGTTSDEIDEAALRIDAEGSYALYVEDGYSRLNVTDFGNVCIGNGSICPGADIQMAITNDNGSFSIGNNADIRMAFDSNGTGDALFRFYSIKNTADDSAALWFARDLNPDNMTDWDDMLSPTLVMVNDEGADANDYSYVALGPRTTSDVTSTWYWDILTGTGAADGSTDSTSTELGAIIRIGSSGTATTGHSLDAGDVLFEGDVEIDGVLYSDGGISGIPDGSGTDNYIVKWQDSDTLTDSVMYDDGTNVGIGTTDPSYKLDVAGTAGFNSGGVTIDGSNYVNAERFVDIGSNYYLDPANTTISLLTAGNIGIGTTAPSQKLHIAGSMRLENALYDYNNQAGTSDQILSSTGTGVDWVDISSIGIGGTGTTGYVPKWLSSSTLGDSVIYEDGTNVGIGVTNPSQKLEVAGDFTFDANNRSIWRKTSKRITLNAPETVFNEASADINFRVEGDTDTHLIFADAGEDAVGIGYSSLDSASGKLLINGNVGIGTTAPAMELDIAGDATLSGTLSLGPQVQAYAGTCDASAEGKMYYDADNDRLYYCDGNDWHTDRTTATLIVAASNSQVKEKADYICDGTNDESEIESAVATLPSGGGVIYLLEGTYNTASSIDIAKSNVTLMGAGKSTVISRTADSYTMIGVGDSGSSSYSGIVITMMALDGNHSTYSDTSNHGIKFDQKIDESVIDSVWFYEHRANSIWLHSPDDANSNDYNTITNNFFTDDTSPYYSGVSLNYSHYTTVANNHFDVYRDGVALNESDYALIKNNYFEEGDDGVVGGSDPNNGATITGNIFRGNNYGVRTGYGTTHILISGNVFDNTNNEGVAVQRTNRANISNNTFYDCGDGSTDDQLIITNLGVGTRYDNQVVGNHFYRSSGTRYAINISSGIERTLISSNTFAGSYNSAGPINDGGSNTLIAGQMLEQTNYEHVLIGPTGASIIGTLSPAGGSKLELHTADASTKGLIIRGASSQTANLQEWQDNGGNILAIVDASGNVGIGTTAPSQELHIDGNMRLTGGLYDYNNQAGTSDQILSSTGTGVDWVDISSIGIGGTGTTGYIPKWLSSSTLGDSVIYDDGTNVGIGTTGPSTKLYINAGDGGAGGQEIEGLTLLNSGGNIGDNIAIVLDPAGNGEAKIVARAPGSNHADLAFVTGNAGSYSETMLLQGSTGYVGIGTTDPLNKLDVSGSVAIGSLSTTSLPQSNMLYVSGNVGIGTTAPGDNLHVVNGLKVSTAAVDGYIDIIASSSNTVSIESGGNDTFTVSSGVVDLVFAPGGGGELRLDSDNVPFIFGEDQDYGIAYNSASDNLEFIDGVDPGVNVRMVLDSSGNLGIGTTDPSQKLHIAGNMRLTGGLYDYNNQAGTSDQILSSTGSGVDWVDISSIGIGGTGTTGYVTKWLSSSTLGDSVIYEDGTNVGIGTTAPGAKLTVLDGDIVIREDDDANDAVKITAGNARGWIEIMEVGTVKTRLTAQDSYFNGGNVAIGAQDPGTAKLYVNGNVGIGTTGPSSALEVNGDITLGDDDWIGIGPSAGDERIIFDSDSNNIEISSYEIQIGQGSIGKITAAGMGLANNYINFKMTAAGDTNSMEIAALHGALTFDVENGKPIILVADGASNVGIGVTSPADKLAVAGGAIIGSGYAQLTSAPSNGLLVEGNVGIGTTDPGATLAIYGDASSAPTLGVVVDSSSTNFSSDFNTVSFTNIDTTVNNYVKLGFNDTIAGYNATAIGTVFTNHTNDYGDLVFWTRSASGFTEKLRVTSGGNVGIGTTAPDSILHTVGGDVYVAGDSGYTFNNPSGNEDLYVEGNLEVDGTIYGAGGSLVSGSGTTNYIPKWTNSSALGNSLIFDDGTNIGIGITAPDGKLHVWTNNAGSVTANAAADEFVLENMGSGGMSILTADQSTSNIVFGSPGDALAAMIKWKYNESLLTIGTSKAAGEIKFISGNESEAVRIDSNGNVGIGTTAPGFDLQVGTAAVNPWSGHLIVAGDSSDARIGAYVLSGTDSVGVSLRSAGTFGEIYAYKYPVGAVDLVLNQFGGNVGIGTTATEQELTVDGNLQLGMSDATRYVYFHDGGSPYAGIRYESGTNKMQFSHDGSSWNDMGTGGGAGYWTLSSSDLYPNLPSYNVGIGTTDSAGTAKLYVNGNVGIGTTAPNEQLEITGNFRLPTTTASTGIIKAGANRFIHNFGTNNAFLGVDAGNLTLSGAVDNVGIGYQALDALTSGDYNVGLGSGALSSSTTGEGNIAIGYNALNSDTDAWDNIAIGREALSSGEPYSYNIAVGRQALYSAIAGAQHNVAIGDQAMEEATWALENVAIGANALFTNDGNNNVAVGSWALDEATSTDFTTAVGDNALGALTSGDNNTAVGAYTGASTTIGHDNVYLGYVAGRDNQTGNYNIFIGAESAEGGSAFTGSDYNVLLGYRAGYNFLSSADYNIFIGPWAGYGYSATSPGNNNVFIGRQAGYSIDGGDDNIFVGIDAGYTNTSGSENTIIGHQAGYSNSSGIYNTFLGMEAGYNTTGDHNTFLGADAGYSNASGDYVTAVGSNALYSNTSNYNTALGYKAGYYLSTGVSNVFIGYNAGAGTTTYTSANNNVIIGYTAGSQISSNTTQNVIIGTQAGSRVTGNNNLCLGYNACYYNQTGQGNVILGYQAGTNNSLYTGADYNVLIGYEAGYYIDDNQDKNIFIGYQAGYNETSSNKLYIESSNAGPNSALIYGDFNSNILTFNGNVGIGTTGPSEKLDVDGSGEFSGTIGLNGAAQNDNRGINFSAINPSTTTHGSYNALNTGTGSIYGVTNYITVDASSSTYKGYGMFTSLSTTNAADYAYGSYVTGSGAEGKQYGEFIELGDTDVENYGNFIKVAGSGIGSFVVADIDLSGYTGIVPQVNDTTAYFFTAETDDDATTQTAYGYRGILETFSGASDTAYGLYLEDAGNSTGGTQYGAYIDIDDPDVTNYSIYVADGSGDSYFGSNVGIGAASPSSLLELASTAPTFRMTDTTGSAKSLLLTVDGDLAQFEEAGGAADDLFVLDLANGNVGIGTTAPGARLDIGGATSTISNTSGDITINAASDSISFAGDDLINIGYVHAQRFVDTGSNYYLDPASTTISGLFAGNVGIGTTAPASELQVKGDILPGADDTYDLGSNSLRWQDLYLGPTTLHIGNSTSDEGIITYDPSSGGLSLTSTSGKVGIGTTDPSSTFHIYNSGADARFLIESGTGYNPKIRFYAWDASYDGEIGLSSGDSRLYLGRTLTETGVINIDLTNQRVGIGTTAPSYDLEVAGTSGIRVSDPSGPAYLTLARDETGIGDGSNLGRVLFQGYDSGNNMTNYAQIRGVADDVTDTTEDGWIQFYGFSGGAGNSAFRFYMDGTGQADVVWNTFSPYFSYNYTEASKTKADYELGDVVALKEEERWVVTQATKEQNGSLHGVVSPPEGFASTPKELKEEVWDNGKNINDFENVISVAHLGEASTKVTLTPGSSISNGTPLTTSALPGFATKAIKATTIVGKALESTAHWNDQNCPAVTDIDSINWPEDDGTNPTKPCFRLPNGTYVGKLMIFVNVSWYDPDSYLTDTGTLAITGDESSGFSLTKDGELYNRIGAFSDAKIANLEVGSLSTQELMLDNFDVGTRFNEIDVLNTDQTSQLNLLNTNFDQLGSEFSTASFGVGTDAPATDSGKLIDTSSGAYLSDSGTWVNASDVNLKENFTELDKEEILEKISNLPVTRWNYKADDEAVTHIGPTAQDFNQAFEVGDETTISTIDPAGIALIGIQALNEKLNNLQIEENNQTLTETGDLVFEEVITEKGQKEFVLKDAAGNILATLSDLGEAELNGIKLISNLVVNKTTDLSDQLAGKLLEIKDATGQTIAAIDETGNILGQRFLAEEKVVAPLIETEEVDTQRISLSDIDSKPGEDVVVNLKEDESQSEFGKLIVKGKDEQEVVSIDVEGNATFSGIIEAEEVRAKKVVAEEIIGLESKFGELLAATVSAQKIQGLEERLAELEAQPSPSPTPTPTPTPSPSPTPSPEPEIEEQPPATESGDPMDDVGLDPEIEALVNEILGTSLESTPQAQLVDTYGENLDVVNNLTVLGITSLADTSVAGSLNVDGTMSLSDSSINTLTDTLYLQNLGLGGIDILAGKIVIDKQGNMTVEGDVTIKGRLALNEIEPMPEQDITIDLTPEVEEENEESSESESKFGKLLIKGVDDEIVASVDASGSAFFASLGIEADYSATESGAIIAAYDNYQKNGYYKSAIETNATAGIGILPAGKTEIQIYNPNITEQSLVYLVPTSDTSNKVLFVKSKQAHQEAVINDYGFEITPEEKGWFTVAINRAIYKDIEFNWWIVGVNQQ